MTSNWDRLLQAVRGEYPLGREAITEKASLVDLAQYHGVEPFLMNTSFDGCRKQNQMKALLNMGHLTRLLDLFSDASIPILVVKGIPLALRLYNDVGSRHAGDIDLWVPEHQVDAVHDLLLQHGHIPKTGYAELSPHYRRLYRLRKIEIGYTHEKTGVSVEIHWRLGRTTELFPLSFDEALSRQQIVFAGSISIPTLSDIDHLQFLYIHAALHMWERLWWLIDIKSFHLLADGPSPHDLLERSRELGNERAVLASWKLTAEFLDFDPEKLEKTQDPVVNKLARWGCEHLINSQSGLNTVRANRFTMSLHRSVSHKWKIIAENITAADDWRRLKLPPGFSWVYILVRPWFWLQRRLAHHQ